MSSEKATLFRDDERVSRNFAFQPFFEGGWSPPSGLFGWHTQSSVWNSGRPDLAQRESAWLVLPLRRYWSLAIPLSPSFSLSLSFWRTRTRWCVPAKLPDQSRGGAFLCAALSIDPLPEVLSLPLLPRSLSTSPFAVSSSFPSFSLRFPSSLFSAPVPLVHFPLSSLSLRFAFLLLFVERALVTPFNPSSYSSACNRVPFPFFFPLTDASPFPLSLLYLLFLFLPSSDFPCRRLCLCSSMSTGCMR